MPRILANADNLNEKNLDFKQSELTCPVFLNSVPKCGTHLLRNIFRMFVPVEQQYHKMFIQIPVLQQHIEAFSTVQPKLSWGHLLFSDDSASALLNVKHLLIVRDPYDWVLARARFFLSDTFQGALENLKNGTISVEHVLNMMIFGIYQKAPNLNEIFTHNAVAWLSASVKLIRFEQLLSHIKQIDTPESKEYFTDIFSWCNFASLPDDWKERVRVGADRKQSGTARENLKGQKFHIPQELPFTQQQMVDYAAPGLRKILGYQ